MLVDARARGCERVFNLGDLGGFGDDCGCGYTSDRDNEFAQLMYDHTRAATGADFAAWMHELPGSVREEIEGVDVHVVHGSPLAVNDFLWESLDDDELRMRLRLSGADVLLCTHTGIPWQRRVDDT